MLRLSIKLMTIICNFFPLILLFGLKLGGIRGNFGWKRLFTFIVLSVVLTQLVVNGLKLTTGVLRPDATNYFSFPSGHTAAAFMAATLLYKEYGFKGYWVGLVAYAVAIVTGFTRILNNRHWLFDVIIGAALGILLTDLAFRWYNSYSKTGDLYNINKYYKLNNTTNLALMKKQMILLGMLMAFCMAEAKVTLPALFTDNMILQQKSNVIFHGHSSTKKRSDNKNGME